MSDTPTLQVIEEEMERIRMHASAGVSVFHNLDILTGYDLARCHLEAIEKSLAVIECAKRTAPAWSQPRRGGP